MSTERYLSMFMECAGVLSGLSKDSFSHFREIKWQQSPENLFHYTDVSGALGILQGQEFWLTHAQYLNDSSEIRHGLSMVANAALKPLEDFDSTHGFREVFNGLLSAFQRDTENLYCISFTELEDDLSQWRGYTKRGNGICLGFKTEDLHKNVTQMRNEYLHAMPVSYDAALQQRVIQKYIQDFADRLNQFLINNPPSDSDIKNSIEYFEAMPLTLDLYLPLFKHPAFAAEKEYRIVLRFFPNSAADIDSATNELSFRERSGLIVPFIKRGVYNFDDEKALPISSVTLGPGTDTNRLTKSFELLRSREGYNYKILESHIPYRL